MFSVTSNSTLESRFDKFAISIGEELSHTIKTRHDADMEIEGVFLHNALCKNTPSISICASSRGILHCYALTS